jgi:hypothetical protein
MTQDAEVKSNPRLSWQKQNPTIRRRNFFLKTRIKIKEKPSEALHLELNLVLVLEKDGEDQLD